MTLTDIKIPNLTYWILGGVLIYLLYRVSNILSLFLISFIIAYLINILAHRIGKLGVPRVPSILLSLLCCILAVVSFFMFLAPPLSSQISQIKNGFVSYFTYMHDQGEKISPEIDTTNFTPDQKSKLYIKRIVSGMALHYPKVVATLGGEKKVISFISSRQEQIVGYILKTLGDISAKTFQFLSQVFNLIIIPILMLYFLFSFDRLKQFLLHVLEYFGIKEKVLPTAREIDDMLASYVRSQFVVMILMGSAIAIAALIISLFFGSQYALFIGTFSGICCIIPYIGFLLIIIIATFLTYSTATQYAILAAIIMLACLIVINQLFDNYITPKIVSNSIGIHPLITIFALLSLGKLIGFFGLLIAMPIAGACKIVLCKVYPNIFITKEKNKRNRNDRKKVPNGNRSENNKIKNAQKPVPVLRIPPVNKNNQSPYSLKENASDNGQTKETNRAPRKRKTFKRSFTPKQGVVKKSLTPKEKNPNKNEENRPKIN